MDILKFKIGCDPEFSFFNGNIKLMANAILPLIPATWPGGVLSVDGHKDTGEINPFPTNSIKEMVQNIYFLISALRGKLPHLQYSASYQKSFLGGHIHLDIPELKKKLFRYNSINTFLNFFWILPFISENKITFAARNSHGYAGIQENRDRWLEHNSATYEFRLPSAEWIIYPKLCEATLAYISTIWHEILFNDLLNKKTPGITTNNYQLDSIYDALTHSYEPVKNTMAKLILLIIKDFELYKTYKNQINYLFKFEEIIKTKDLLQYEISTGWNDPMLWFGKIPKLPQCIKSLPPDPKVLQNTYPVYFNQDFNMSWVQEKVLEELFNKRTILNHPIAFYGLKKGIEDYYITSLKGILGDITKFKDEAIILKLKKTTDKILNRTPFYDAISIGIPYSDREKQNIEPLLGIITNGNGLKPTPWKEIIISTQNNQHVRPNLST